MLKKLYYGTWMFLLLSNLAYAQLPDFTEMVKNNGDAVVNISSTQKAPEPQAAGGGGDQQQQMPQPQQHREQQWRDNR